VGEAENVVCVVAVQEPVQFALELFGRGGAGADGFDLGHAVHGGTGIGRTAGRGLVDPEVKFALVSEWVSAELAPCALKRHGCLIPFATLPGVAGFGTER
jgi:hypothetical protein